MKEVSLIILFFLLFLPLVSAVQIEMKTSFNQGETLMAKFSGNFLETVTKENILLYREHERIPFEPYIKKINEEYYIYAQLLGKEPENYSLSIENVKYMKSGKISEEDIKKNFTILENMADFLINPGFVVADKDFFIEVQNLQDYGIVIEVKTINYSETEESVTLKSGAIKKINFEIEDFKGLNFSIITLSTGNLIYEIPASFFGKEGEKEKETLFRFDPSELNVSLATGSNATRKIYLYNLGEEILENISLSLSDSLKPYISLSEENIEELEENSSIMIELRINSSTGEKNLKGQIKAKTGSNYTYFALYLNFIKNFTPSKDENISDSGFKTCSQYGGEICDDEEECDGETKSTPGGVCCLGTCIEEKEDSTGRTIGIILLVLVIAILGWVYFKKYKGTKKRNVDLLKIAQGKKK